MSFQLFKAGLSPVCIPVAVGLPSIHSNVFGKSEGMDGNSTARK